MRRDQAPVRQVAQWLRFADAIGRVAPRVVDEPFGVRGHAQQVGSLLQCVIVGSGQQYGITATRGDLGPGIYAIRW